VRMREGTLRFQARYLKKTRVPRPADVTEDLAEKLRQAFRTRDTAAIPVAAHHAYGLNGALVAAS
jgi:adenine-specific DNA-methyltransferase